MKLKLPYGISHYKTVIEEGYTYLDKTGWIQTIEDTSRYNLIMRPRRFGKSLFVSMLAYYYDFMRMDGCRIFKNWTSYPAGSSSLMARK